METPGTVISIVSQHNKNGTASTSYWTLSWKMPDLEILYLRAEHKEMASIGEGGSGVLMRKALPR